MKAVWALEVFLSCNPGASVIVVPAGVVSGAVVAAVAILGVGCDLLASYLESN